MMANGETGATAGNGKRPKKQPVFHVFRQADDGRWDLLTVKDGKAKPVTAASRRQGIRQVADELGEHNGVFAAIRDDEWKPLRRESETKTVDTFAAA